MGWGRVEWYWHMGMSYLTSLNPQLFKNIAYVWSFKHFSVQLFFTFYIFYKTSANSSDMAMGAIIDNLCQKNSQSLGKTLIREFWVYLGTAQIVIRPPPALKRAD